NFIIIHKNFGRNNFLPEINPNSPVFFSPEKFTEMFLGSLLAVASNDGPYCVGETIQLNGGPNGEQSYAWSGPNGFSILPATITVTQNFNTLITTGTATWFDNSTVIDWYSQRSGNGTTIVANNGSNTAGNLYSYGTGTETDRALGTVGSGNVAAGNFAHGVAYHNLTGQTIYQINVTYTLEQWRNSGAAGQSVTFWYKKSSSPITALEPGMTATWTQVTALTGTSPITGGTAGALNGNDGANRITLSNILIPNLTLSANEYLMLKWEDPDHSGSDHGLAIDDVSIAYKTAGIQNPTIPGATLAMSGIYILTVTDSGGNTTTASTTVSIFSNPTATCPNDTTMCSNSASYNLTGGTPSGGVYTGTGVSGGVFNPAVASIGANVITYTYTDVNGCSGLCTFTITVNSSPVAIAGTYGPACPNDPDIILTGSPGGGVWSGIGVTGNNFNPNAGTQTLTYTVTTMNGCTDTDQTTITVNQCLMAPEMRWVLLEEGEQHGSCTSASDCDNNIICYGLQYTPNITGNVTSYTTSFFANCNAGSNPVISNASCVMTNASFVEDGCVQFGIIRLVSSANNSSGNHAVTKNIPTILHQVCFTIPSSSISIAEDQVGDLTVSIDSVMGGGVEDEYPSYVTYSIDSSIDCSILPVRFLNFTASRYDNLMSQLDWTTADETNNDYFEVQRSNDGGASFQKIGIVDASLIPRSINNYQFIDSFAKSGQNYYRLKQFDTDGKFMFSPVRNVLFGLGKFTVSAYPNPVADILNINIESADEPGKIFLYDILGREVMSIDFESGFSENQATVYALEPAVYTLVVTTGINHYEQKIVVIDN
ncbi:MAG TPA: T9SS type A sorting domain-containing protein, partial [Saprospiraceae bacterium]|nr:T9SS type A sorting domain-containing protein [Saprospiraceae bacterium]